MSDEKKPETKIEKGCKLLGVMLFAADYDKILQDMLRIGPNRSAELLYHANSCLLHMEQLILKGEKCIWVISPG